MVQKVNPKKINPEGSDFDVIIIGSGWSGLMACKYCLGEGLRTIVLEARDSIGGVWAFTQNTEFGGVMKTTETTSSRCITEISDFPMPEDYPAFPSHTEIISYLESYSVKFGLNRYIKFNHQVVSARKSENFWLLSCKNGIKYKTKKIIVCSGVHQRINDVSAHSRFDSFKGSLIHSAEIKEVLKNYSGKTVVIWGGGESASDIAFEMSKQAEKLYWCIPNGQWFVPKRVERWPPFPSKKPKIADHISSRVRMFFSPTYSFSPFIYQYLETIFGFNGHGIPSWKTNAPYNRSFFNKSTEVLSHVKSGKITAKRDIVRCKNDNVYFDDGSHAQTDAIITCSGYSLEVSFFSEESKPNINQQKWYKYIFPDDPSIAFIGFARPIFGSIPALSELQARYVSLVFSGKKLLPSLADRIRVAKKDTDFWNHHFRFTSKRLDGLVDHFLYSNQLARLSGCYPRFWKLFLTTPSLWWVTITSPWNGCQFWLNDKSQHDRILKTMKQYGGNKMSEVYIFLILAPILPVLRLWSYMRVFFLGKKLVPNKNT